MTFEELQQRAAYYATIGAFTDSETPPDWPTLVNRAYRQYMTATRAIVAFATSQTVASQSEYDVPATLYDISEMAYDGKTKLGARSIGWINEVYPAFASTPPGTPLYWCMTRPRTFMLYPTPVTGGVSLAFTGTGLPTPLAAGSEPEVDEGQHEAIALLAAILHCAPLARGEENGVVSQWMKAYADTVNFQLSVNLAKRVRSARVRKPPATRVVTQV